MADFTMYDREREFKWQIECQLRGGTNAYIDAEDIYSGRLTRQISSGEGIEVGSCYVSELDLTIVASALPSNVISVKPYFRLLTSTEIVEGVVRKYYTPYNLGVFKIASTKRKEYGRIDLVCYDKMADLDTLITPAAYTELLASDWKPFYLLDWIATKVGVTYTFTQSGIEAMPNGTLYFKLAEETSNIKTYRDLLQYVCMLIGAYGIFDEDGHLNIKTFADTTSYSLPASFRFSESFGDVPIAYSGVELTVKNATTMFGNASNTVVRLSDNPFLYNLSTLNQTTDYATFIMQFLRNIYTEFQGLSYYAGEFEIPPDASLNVGRLLAVSGGGASDTINCFLQKIDVNFDGRMSLSCGNPNTYVARTQNRTTSSITNLTNRIETLESSGSGGGNKVYTSKSAPDTTLGSEGDLWVKYFADYNDKLINSLGNEVDINLPRYESADDAYNYVDLTIRPDIRSMCNLATTAINAFVKGYEGKISIVAFCGSMPTRNITASQFPQLTVDTYTTNNQSFSISNGGNFLSWSDNPVHYRYIGTSESDLLPFGAIVNMDDFNESLLDGHEITVLYYYVYYNTSNKKFEYIHGSIKFENVNHTYWSDKLNKQTSNISIDLLDTAYYTIDELYCKINDDWTLYESDGGSTVIVNQILQSGTEIAQISVDGKVVSIYAPTTTVTQTLTSGTEIAQVNGTSIYAPTPQSVSVTQTQTSGTEIGSITIDNNTTKLYAPSGGGSDITVTPKTSTGTNIADIEVDGTIYQLFAPSGGGGGSYAHNYSTSEHIVGTWIDGSTIYEKTVEITTVTTGWNDVYYDENINIIGYIPNASWVDTTPLYFPNFINAYKNWRKYYAERVITHYLVALRYFDESNSRYEFRLFIIWDKYDINLAPGSPVYLPNYTGYDYTSPTFTCYVPNIATVADRYGIYSQEDLHFASLDNVNDDYDCTNFTSSYPESQLNNPGGGRDYTLTSNDNGMTYEDCAIYKINSDGTTTLINGGERMPLDWYTSSTVYNRTVVTENGHKFRVEIVGGNYTKLIATLQYTKTS